MNAGRPPDRNCVQLPNTGRLTDRLPHRELSETHLKSNDLLGREYRSFDGQRRWELLFEHVLIVILDTGMKRGTDYNLVGIDTRNLCVVWSVGGVVESVDQYDGIVNVWVEDGRLWAGTWSDTVYQIEHETGRSLKQEWRK